MLAAAGRRAGGVGHSLGAAASHIPNLPDGQRAPARSVGSGRRTTLTGDTDVYVTVNGCRLFVDIEGAKLVPDGPVMREKPTLVLLHGGPAFDHSMYKPAFSALADVAQIVYYDHRANGRSDDGPIDSWTLDQWGDDVKGLCDALGIERPVVLGTSFGGFVAQAYATRHPGHAAKLILMNTAARLDLQVSLFALHRNGGARARSVTERLWTDLNPAAILDCFALHELLYFAFPAADDPDENARAVVRSSVLFYFSGPSGEHWRMDYREDLARVSCPTLVIGAEDDNITPIEQSEEIAAALPPGLARFERLPGSGHPLYRDRPEETLRLIRDFLEE